MNKSKVIAVGSAPHINGKGLGPLIDSYENVVRVNWYPTIAPHTDDIGVRQDKVVFRADTMGISRYLKLNTERNEQLGSTMDSENTWIICRKELNEKDIIRIKDMFGKDTLISNKTTATESVRVDRKLPKQFAGVLAILTAYAEYGVPVDIVGFTTEIDGKGYKHYWDEEEVQKAGDPLMVAQVIALQKLMREGIIGEVLGA